MKHFYLPIFVIFCGILFLSNSSNPPNGRTGAPGETLCSSCHGGNAPIQGNVRIEGLPESIVPGTSYDLSIRAGITSGTVRRVGFQFVALDENNQNIGNLENPGANVAFETQNNNGRRYAEHRPARNINNQSETSFTFTWTAPEEPMTEEVRFFAVAVLADGNGTSSGDRVVTDRLELNFENTSSDNLHGLADKIEIRIFPNPSSNQIQFDFPITWQQEDVQVQIFDASGRQVAQQKIWGNENKSLDISQLKSGAYIVMLTNKMTAQTIRFTKI